ncbi:MAG: hypothetical protein KF727_02310 [Microbacteriaceae bacterium]|nr:hypothetical protein [Microbacteriaceae bacterium]
MILRTPAIAVPALALVLLSGCATVGGGSGDAGGGTGGGAGGGTPNCEGVTTGGWEIFRDDRLTVTPDADVIPLQAAGDVIEFTDSGYTEGTTYGYDLAYVDGGQAFGQGGAPFFDSEGATFRLEGPQAPVTADGGPYAGILSVTATDSAGTTVLGNVCVMLATDE